LRSFLSKVIFSKHFWQAAFYATLQEPERNSV